MFSYAPILAQIVPGKTNVNLGQGIFIVFMAHQYHGTHNASKMFRLVPLKWST